ncbi:MAG TPA: tetratricopeptide repeat protein [Thermoanaerobaculia bacterium]
MIPEPTGDAPRALDVLRRAASLLLPAAILGVLSACASRPSPIAIREDFPFDPREGLTPPFPGAVERGWESLAAGDPATALERFARAPFDPAAPAAAIGRLEAALLLDRNAEAGQACERLLPTASRTVALLASCGEAAARQGKRKEGLALYREALAIAPERRGLRSRAEDLHVTLREELLRSAASKAAAKDPAAARAIYREAVELDPESSRVLAAAASFELASGSRGEAFELYRQALERDPSNPELQQHVAELALAEGDPALAVSLYEALARSDPPTYSEKAAEARIAFRVQNWPPPEQSAARSARLTRAQTASLVWWSVPEVRDAYVTTGVIASDIVGRPDSRELARMLALGLLEVDGSHRARPDAPLTTTAAARLSLRLLAMLRRGYGPPACLKDRPTRRGGQAARAAAECGIPIPSAGAVSGQDLLRALDKIRLLAETGVAS